MTSEAKSPKAFEAPSTVKPMMLVDRSSMIPNACITAYAEEEASEREKRKAKGDARTHAHTY